MVVRVGVGMAMVVIMGRAKDREQDRQEEKQKEGGHRQTVCPQLISGQGCLYF